MKFIFNKKQPLINLEISWLKVVLLLCVLFIKSTNCIAQNKENMLEVKKVNIDTNDLQQLLSNIVADNEIAHANWESHPYKPEVKFGIVYTDNEIVIKYSVRENAVRAVNSENNSAVYEDSCCEFFVSPNCDDCYYNFETNCIGTMLLGYKKLGEKSTRANENTMNSVRRFSTFGNETFDTQTGDFSWEMIVVIPFTAFFNHDIKSIEGKTFTANFYKCGDKLPTPHYLSWNPIKTEKPSFHQPAFFGKLKFLESTF